MQGSQPHAVPAFELAAAEEGSLTGPSIGTLLAKRPVAALALIPRSAVLFGAGAVAGALGAHGMEGPPCFAMPGVSSGQPWMTRPSSCPLDAPCTTQLRIELQTILRRHAI